MVEWHKKDGSHHQPTMFEEFYYRSWYRKAVIVGSDREDACQLISCYWDPLRCPSSSCWWASSFIHFTILKATPWRLGHFLCLWGSQEGHLTACNQRPSSAKGGSCLPLPGGPLLIFYRKQILPILYWRLDPNASKSRSTPLTLWI